MEDKIDEIQKKVTSPSIYIKRVPRKIKVEFVDWANEEFESDWGMALKWLWDFKQGLLSSPNQILIDQIEVLTQEIEELKSGNEKKKKVIRSVGGRVITERGEQNE